MPIEINDDLIRHVAVLARLDLSDEDAQALRQHFEKILTFIESFQALDTDSVDPSYFADASRVNVDRADETLPSLPVEDVLRNAPAAHPPHFLVPRIVGGESGGSA